MKKNILMLGSIGFFFGVTRMGMVNKLFLSLMSTQFVTFYFKSKYYQLVVDDLASQMTLVG